LAVWTNGLAFRDFQFGEEGWPVIKIAELKDGVSGQTRFTRQTFEERYHVKQGDMLFSWSGNPDTSIDVFWWRGGDGWLNQHIFKVEPTDVDTRFFYYLLRYLRPTFAEIARNKQTTGLGHVTAKDLKSLLVGVPPLRAQERIAAVLSSLDDKIELNRRTNQTLEQMAQALFKSWFVDFDPVRAKSEGQWEKGESLPGMPADMRDLWPSEFEDSEIGEIPRAWKAGTLGDLASMNPESWSTATRPEAIHYVDISSTKRGRIEEIATYSASEAPSRAQRVLRRGDTILGTVRPGNNAYSLISGDGLTGSTGFAVLRPKRPDLAEFVYLAVTARENIEDLASLADGSAYPAVSAETVSSSPAVICTDEIMTRFSAAARPLFEMTASHGSQSDVLAHLRDTLLLKFLSGEIRVPRNDGA
jgi:type I restriction enzyme S subunit